MLSKSYTLFSIIIYNRFYYINYNLKVNSRILAQHYSDITTFTKIEFSYKKMLHIQFIRNYNKNGESTSIS